MRNGNRTEFERWTARLAEESTPLRKRALAQIVDIVLENLDEPDDGIQAIADVLGVVVAETAQLTLATLPEGWTKR